MKHSKQTIIEQGQELFREHGYHATGVSTILNECNISKGTFYNYFSSKDEFAIQTLENYSHQVQKLIRTYMAFSSMSPSKRVKRYFEQLIKLNQSEGAHKGCLLMNFMVELAGDDSKFSDLTKSHFDNWIDLLAPTIEEAQRKKEFTNRFPAKQIARYIYLQLYGDFATMKARRSTTFMASQLNMTFDLLKP